MASADDIRQLCERYVTACSTNNLDAVVALFASNAVLHDPVDSPAVEGVKGIREFFAQGVDVVQSVKLLGPVHITADCRHAAARLEAKVNFGEGFKIIEGIDVWTFDEDGQIATMNAYWGPTNLRDA